MPVATIAALGSLAALALAASLALRAYGGVMTAIAGLLLAAALVLGTIAVSVRLRAQVGARVSWDAWGVFEHEGSMVRTAIAWREARAHVERSEDGVSIDILQLSDRAGRAITIAVPGIPIPGWMQRRPTLSPDLEEIPIAGLPRARFVMDPRDAARPDAPWLADAALVPLAAVCAPIAWALWGMPSAIAVIGGALALAALPGAIELARLVHGTLAIRGARAVRLLRRERAIVCATDLEGAPVRLDPRTIAGHDGSLAERPRGTVFVRLRPPARDDGPYRDGTGAALVVVALETWCDRIRRRSRLVAAGVETALRVAAILFALAVGSPAPSAPASVHGALPSAASAAAAT